mgnify:CR=1 FL=1
MPLPDELAEFLPDFQNEARQNLRRLENGMLMFENQSYDRDILDDLLRAAHTIKGSARMMGYDHVSTLAHAIEDVLVLFQADRLVPNSANIDVLLNGLDSVRQIVELPPGTPVEIGPVLEELQGLTNLDRDDLSAAAVRPSTTKMPTGLAAEVRTPPPTMNLLSAPITGEDWVRVSTAKLDELLRLMGELVLVSQQTEQLQRDLVAHLNQMRAFNREIATEPALNARFRPLLGSADQLRRQVKQIGRELSSTRDALEDEVVELRLVPMAELFATLPRAVRNLGHNTGKDINLTITGENTRIDRQQLQALNEPIIHILRNAVDHGIEPADERETYGKPAAGNIRISVTRRGTRIVVQVRDDGRGISAYALRRSAVNKGLLTQAQADALSDTEALELIYASGLSTAAYITETSGRGVGMGAVRAALARMGGALSVTTRELEGTTFTIEIPVTLALARVLIVEVAGQRYALPDSSIETVIRLGHGRLRRTARGAFVTYQDRLLPVYSLGGLLKHTHLDFDEKTAIVLQTADDLLAVTIEQVIDEQQVVIKPLGKLLDRTDLVLGATFLSDGAVIAILDPNSLQRIVRFDRFPQASSAAETDGEMPMPMGLQRRRVLVVEDSITTRELERAILYNAGYIVEVAENGRQALELMSATSFDLVVSDIEMPEMDGYQLCKAMQQTPKFANIPVVLVTSVDNEDAIRRGLEVGAMAYITKQEFDAQRLLDAVERLLI